MAETNEQVAFDATRQQLGSVYAKALLGAAGDQADAVLEQLESFVDDVLAAHPKLDAALCSPRIAVTEKERILDAAFADKMHATLLRFLKVLVANGRMDCLREIRRAARELVNEQQGRVAVRVKTAEPVDEALAASISERLSQSLGRQVEMSCEVEPGLIGGLVVRVGDTVYDASVANRLRRLRETALQRTSETIRNTLDRFSD